MKAIYRDYPQAKNEHRGFFKHYRRYMFSCFNELSQEDREWFEQCAAQWSRHGASQEVKSECVMFRSHSY